MGGGRRGRDARVHGETIPSYVEVVTICAHPEPAGQAGAIELADRLTARGIEVILQQANVA